MRLAALIWVLRWDVVSDRTLEEFIYAHYNSDRPYYGAFLWRAGWLKRHPVQSGYRLTDGKFVYSLSRTAYDFLVQVLEQEEPSDILNLHPFVKKRRPAWTQLDHLFDLQRIALCYEDTYVVDDGSWHSEPETRQMVRGDKVPDLIVNLGPPTHHWVEYERTPKDDLRLHYMVQRIANMFDGQEHPLHPVHPGPWGADVTGITIIVRTEH